LEAGVVGGGRGVGDVEEAGEVLGFELEGEGGEAGEEEAEDEEGEVEADAGEVMSAA
jgi:hypothetical protein